MLKQGDKLPTFDLESDAGKRVRSGDFAGKKLVVYFYPRDNTPGCTRESIAFSEALSRLKASGASVVGISKDSIKSHCTFRDKYALKVPLLSDPDLAVHNAFGVYGEKTLYGKKVMGVIRSTFIVDGDGTIAKVFPSVKVDGHVDAVLAALGDRASAPQVGAAKKPVAKKPVAKKAVAKKPAATKPAAKKAIAKKMGGR